MRRPKRIIIFTNGTLHSDFTLDLEKNDYLIGVDKAAYWLIQQNIVPDLAIGDFDSTSQDELIAIKQICKSFLPYSTNKDYTDTDLALQEAIKANPREIIIYGAVGTRIDHTLANISLLENLLRQHIPSCIRDMYNEIRLIDTTFELKKHGPYKYVSILPVSDTTEISLDGFAYNLNHVQLHRNQSLGISNEISEDFAKVTIHSGLTLVIQSKDE